METRIFADDHLLAEAAAGEILEQVIGKPASVLCLASGDTPRLAYRRVVERATTEGIDFSQVHWVSLDEWVGIEATNPGSCYYFLNETLFSPLDIQPSQIHFFNGLSTSLSDACLQMDNLIARLGGIDLILLGVGMNGHLGFNEPGVRPDLKALVIELDPVTVKVGQKYFPQAATLSKGITLGLAHLLAARTALMMASGQKKAAIVREALQGDISNRLPASMIRAHPHALTLLDQAAASLL